MTDPLPPFAPGAVGRTAARRPLWRTPRRRLRFTRAGWLYMGLTFGVGFGAISSGNNLLFLVLGLLLGGIILSGILSEAVLLGLHAERVLPLEARAGRAALVGMRLVNEKKRVGSYAVLVRDFAGDAARRPGIVDRAVARVLRRDPDRGAAGGVFFLKLDGGAAREGAYRWVPARRGAVAFERVEISTRFPFGLFEKWFVQKLASEMVVFPRERPLPPASRQRTTPPGELPEVRAGEVGDFFALRDARDGDDARHIHWPTSARQGRTIVVERERERARRVAVVVDNRIETPPEVARREGGPAALLDDAAEEAAAIVRRAALESAEFALCASGVQVPPGAGPVHERRVLRALALLAPAPSGPAPVVPARAEVRHVSVRPAPAHPPQRTAGQAEHGRGAGGAP